MENNEIWKYIPNFNFRYQVSNLGRIKSLSFVDSNGHFHKEKIMTPRKTGKKGYLQVTLKNNGDNKSFYVHRLVGMMFVSGYKEGLQINHKDENVQNNNSNNLEWCTAKYNINYGNHRKHHIDSIYSKKPVSMFTKEGTFVRDFISASEAARFVKGNVSHILDCCNHKPKYKSVKGYIFKYK